MHTELTSDGKHLLLHGRVPLSVSVQLVDFKLNAMRWKIPSSHALAMKYMPNQLAKLVQTSPTEVPLEKPTGIDDSLWDKLFLYQKETVCSVIHRYKGRCLLAHDMGLGKTVQAIALMQHYGSPVLVVCPSFLKRNWERELEKWAPDVEAVIVSYDLMRTRPPPLRSIWKLVVADECHYIKHINSLRSQATFPFIMQCDHALMMSGTPCPNRPEELFAPLHALRPSIVPNFNWFAKRYCNARKTRFCNFDTTGHSRKGELSWLLRRAYMIRKTKEEVKLQLPPKHQIEVHVKSKDKKTLNKIAETLEMMEDAQPLATRSLVSESFRMTCRAKLDVVSSFCAAQARKAPTVVFAHHRGMLDALQSAGEENGLVCLRIDGDTDSERRQQIVDMVQHRAFDLACFSMGATGVGLTLTAVSDVIFAELPWNPAVLRQCEDRVYRIGQESPCFIRYLLCEDTLDAIVWKTIYTKERVSRAIM